MKNLSLAALSCLILPTLANGSPKNDGIAPDQALLILNAPKYVPASRQFDGDNKLPKNWRTSADPFKRKKTSTPPSKKGLETLHASGSGEFSKGQFKQILESLGGKKPLVIDLRQEPHGFVNELAVSWYGIDDAINARKSPSEIEQDEKVRLESLKSGKKITLKTWAQDEENEANSSSWKNFTVDPKTVETEQAFLNQLGVSYLRLPSADHQRPTDNTVDTFMKAIRELNPGQWVHFHCAAGVGRTTSFMAMYDMVQNCNQVSFKDILERQYLLGGADLLNTSNSDPKRRTWAKERAQFLEKFYQYCKEQAPQFKRSWSDWIQQK